MSENCRHCGKEIDRGMIVCADCRSLAGEKKKTGRIWAFSILFSAVLLFLTGLMVWHGGFGGWSLPFADLWGKPVAVINGESIPRKEFKARMMSVKSAIERQHGKNIFTGERGEALLGALAQEVLDGMLEERLVAQEARKLKVEIRQAQVEGEVQKISKEMYGNREKFQAGLREDGISPDELKTQVYNLLLYKALREAKTPRGADPEVSFNAWLIQAKQRAELVVYETGNRGSGASFSGGSCCAPSGPSGEPNASSGKGGSLDPRTENEAKRAASGGSCCAPGGPSGGPGASSGRDGPMDSQTESEAKKAALEAFQKGHPADQGVSARVTDYGCHIQVDIQKEGKVVKSYSYQGGKAFEIS